MNQWQTKIVAECHFLLGLNIHEDPPHSNSGRYIDDFLEFVGLAPGQPWCAAAACWIVHHVGITDGPRTGSTGAVHDWAIAHGKTLAAPVIGCLGLLEDASTSTGFRHTVIITNVLPFGLVRTTEGNLGDALRRNIRHTNGLKFVQPW